MAERSFKQEVQKLRLGKGEEFRGEGILAVTKALLQCGVGYVGGYQGAPISHLMDVLADAQDLLAELDVHYEANASESAASAMLAASVHQPIRGAVTFKAPVGINVASDALANLSSGGVTGGALILIGEDYGEGSSIMQERSHAYATKSQIWLLDPRPNLPSIVKAVADAFELSEASNTPVMLELRIRACHVYGSFTASDNRRPPLTVSQALDAPRRNTDRIVLPPASYVHEQEKVNQRWPAAVEFIRGRGLNEIFGPSDGPVGIVMQGGMYNGVIRALQRLGLADVFGDSRIPLYVLNVTYPLVDSEFLAFCEGKQALLVVEEGQPAYIEDALAAILYRAQGSVHLTGKDLLPPAGEYIGQHVLDGVGEFLKRHAPEMLRASGNGAGTTPAEGSTIGELAASVPVRPPSFCTGCPERPIFAAMKLAQKEVGAYKACAAISASVEILAGDAVVDMNAYLGKVLGRRLSMLMEAAYADGDGSNKPTGLFTLGTPDTTALSADATIDFWFSLAAQYRSRAAWIMNDASLKAVRKLKTTGGEYLWLPAERYSIGDAMRVGVAGTLLGSPVYVNNHCPDDEYVLCDPGLAFRIYDRGGTTMLTDPYTNASTGKVNIYAYRRTDSTEVIGDALKIWQPS